MKGFKETRFAVKTSNGETRYFPSQYEKGKYELLVRRVKSSEKEAPKNTGSPFKKGE